MRIRILPGRGAVGEDGAVVVLSQIMSPFINPTRDTGTCMNSENKT